MSATLNRCKMSKVVNFVVVKLNILHIKHHILFIKKIAANITYELNLKSPNIIHIALLDRKAIYS